MNLIHSIETLIERSRQMLDADDVDVRDVSLVTTRQARTMQMIPGSVIRIMRIRMLKLGDAKVEMGLSRYDYRMSQALERTAQPRPEVLRALEPWLHKNKAHL